MNSITTGASFDRAKAIGATQPQNSRRDLPQAPSYTFLSARDLRGLVAAMVD